MRTGEIIKPTFHQLNRIMGIAIIMLSWYLTLKYIYRQNLAAYCIVPVRLYSFTGNIRVYHTKNANSQRIRI